jgi:uncharacterized phiE125 gp8 family phage protein
MILTIYSQPAIEPVSLETAKDHLRVTHNDEDDYISLLITAARKHVEDFTGRALITQTWDQWFDRFPYGGDAESVVKSPIQSVTSVTYVDINGATQTLSTSVYVVDTDSNPALFYLAYNQTWPTFREQRKAIKIRFVAGYGDTEASVPAPITQAVMHLVAHMYENREPVSVGNTVTQIPFSVEALLTPYRVAYL